VNRRTRILVSAAVLIVIWNGTAGAAEPPAILAFYENGVLVSCVQGAAHLADVPYREDTSDPRSRIDFVPAHARRQPMSRQHTAAASVARQCVRRRMGVTGRFVQNRTLTSALKSFSAG
jgi:hypothetical protein